MRGPADRILGTVLRWGLGTGAGEAALGDLLEQRAREAAELGPGAARRRFLRRLLSLAVGALAYRLRRRRRTRGGPEEASSRTASGRRRSRSGVGEPGAAGGGRPGHADRPGPGAGRGWLDGLAFDLRHALRSLRRRPLAAFIAVLTIGLGLGAGAAVFAVADTALLRPLPYPEPERLVELWREYPESGAFGTGLPAGTLPVVRARSDVFSGVEAWDTDQCLVTGAGEPAEVPVAAVTPGLHGMLGARPQIGRLLDRGDDAEPVAVLAHRTWVRRFDRDPGVTGRQVVLDDVPHTIVGVMPERFRHPSGGIAVWVPLAVDDAAGSVRMMARLRADAGEVALETALAGLTTGLQEEGILPGSMRIMPQPLEEVRSLMTGEEGRRTLWLLLGAVALVLLIAVANLAQLRVAHLVERRGELAVAAALGASRSRLARRLLMESFALAAAGGLVGLLAASWAIGAVAAVAPDRIGFFQAWPLRIDARVGLCVLAAVVLTGLLAGLLAAARLPDRGLSSELAAGAAGGTVSRGHRRLRAGLVLAEVMVSMVLLLGAGLVARELISLHRVDPGFALDGRSVVEVTLGRSRYPDPESRAAVLPRLRDRLQALPGVERTVVADGFPPRAGAFVTLQSIEVEGVADPDVPTGRAAIGTLVQTGPGYFRALGVPLLRGRGLRADDRDVAVLDEELARRLWPDGDALGGRFRLFPGSPWVTVVGVVPDVRHTGFAEGAGWTEIYRPLGEGREGRAYEILLQTRPGAPVAGASVVEALRGIDPDLPVSGVDTLRQRFADDLSRQRFQLTLMGALAGIAELLAAIGLFGVVSMLVAAGTREIGVRVALGAAPSRIFRRVLGRGLALAGGGALLGGFVGWILARLLGSVLFEIDALDPVVYAAAGIVVVAVAAAACAVPARRATRVDPVRALRSE